MERVITTPTHEAAYFTNRQGYQSDFLGVDIPLPTFEPGFNPDCPYVQQGVGPNGPHMLDYTHFSICFNKGKQLPYYTAVNIDGPTHAEARPEHDDRKNDHWSYDGRINTGDNPHQFGNADYANTPFQKGHMVRYFDPAWGGAAIELQGLNDTFHYTNCCPQIGDYNVGIWGALENYYLNSVVLHWGKLTVFSGPLFQDLKRVDKLNVPVSFWKVLIYHNEQGHLEATAYMMTHEFALQPDLASSPTLANELAADFRYYINKKLFEAKSSVSESRLLRLSKKILENKVFINTSLALLEKTTNLRFGLNELDIHKNQPVDFMKEVKPDEGALVDTIFLGGLNYPSLHEQQIRQYFTGFNKG